MCSVCSLYFTTKIHLYWHSHIHSQQRQFACPNCFKCFRQCSTARTHTLIHSTRDQRRFKCQSCFRTFNHKKGIRNHVKKTNHNSNDFDNINNINKLKVIRLPFSNTLSYLNSIQINQI
jgi:Zn-finger protein